MTLLTFARILVSGIFAALTFLLAVFWHAGLFKANDANTYCWIITWLIVLVVFLFAWFGKL